ncbi:kinesin light chain 3 isoform X2 [Iris pallida]|uniref:Kinesin light chain 3 isoform X2 n=1 Tax=Iris pallida TaxID=29817 RepID=A0AAX6HXR5_IRIPA|nr:kinesin light chain 3 isoform X2 [Iris pallida]
MSYERALKIEGRVLGHGHPDYANTMYHLGTVLHLQGKEKDSETLIRESIRILEENGLGETTTCIRRMRYFSQMLLSSNQLVEAENVQRKMLHTLELSKGWGSLDTVVAAEGLALTLQALGNLTEAKDLLARCLEARKKILPENHIQVAANMLHLARLGVLNTNRLRKLNITEARAELDKAKLSVDNAIRIAKEALDCSRKNQNSIRSSSVPNGSENDLHMALTILLQSLDFIGLLDVTKRELLEAAQESAFPFDAELALRDCISIFKEPATRSLLNSPDVKAEYLSSLKHLANIVTENIDHKTDKSGALKELRDEVRRIQVELSPSRRQRH